jgi:quercetin dioxygenase-like cupin family protein
VHSLADCPHVIDLRNMGLIAGIELEPIAGEPTKRAFFRLPRRLRAQRPDPDHGGHHRAEPAADHREGAYRRCSGRCGTSSRGCIDGDMPVGDPDRRRRVRVTRFDFGPGDETGWHRHGMDYVITALTDCPMRLEESGGTVREVMVPHGTVYRPRGGRKTTINGGDAPMTFIETELK